MTLLLIIGWWLVQRKSIIFDRKWLWGSGIFAFTLFPPQLLKYGFSGWAFCLILAIQNIVGILGLVIIVKGVIGLLGDKSPFFRLKDSGKSWLFVCVASILLFLLVASLGRAVLGGIPHIGDEQVQLWQAKIYSSGHFSVPVPQPIEFFFDPFMFIRDGRWYSQYPPGFALLLVPGVVLHHPELVNPVIAGLSLIIFGLVLKEINLSRWWMLLFVFSPLVLFMSASMMNHASSLFFGALGIYCFLKSKRDKAGWLFLWGLATGYMFSVRPFTALCFNLPLLFLMLRKKVGAGILTSILGFVIGAIPFFINNYHTTGSIFTAGYQYAWDGKSGFFFTESPWGPIHTPQFGLSHLLTLLNGLNGWLFEVPLPALTGVVLWLVLRKDKNWKEWGIFACGACSVGGYFFYYYVDLTYGPRFAYEAVFPWLIISAMGFKVLYRQLRDSGYSRAKAHGCFFLGGLILLGVAGTISFPARIAYYSHRYRDVDKNFVKFISAQKLGNAIVFLDDYPSTDRHARLFSLGFSNRQAWYYAWKLNDTAVKSALEAVGIPEEKGYGKIVPLSVIGMALNRFWGNPDYFPSPAEDMDRPYIPLKQGYDYMNPDIARNDIIFARDLGKHNDALQKAFPDRKCFKLSLTRYGYTLTPL
jgi:hypothetical protein